jgi:hypothetical protein
MNLSLFFLFKSFTIFPVAFCFTIFFLPFFAYQTLFFQASQGTNFVPFTSHYLILSQNPIINRKTALGAILSALRLGLEPEFKKENPPAGGKNQINTIFSN